jgi:hypothetical protein
MYVVNTNVFKQYKKKGDAKLCVSKTQLMVMMELISNIYVHGHTKWLFSETYSKVRNNQI